MEKIEKVLTFDEMERDYKNLNLMLKCASDNGGSAYVLAAFSDSELADALHYSDSLDFFVDLYRTSCSNTPFVSVMDAVKPV